MPVLSDWFIMTLRGSLISCLIVFSSLYIYIYVYGARLCVCCSNCVGVCGNVCCVEAVVNDIGFCALEC